MRASLVLLALVPSLNAAEMPASKPAAEVPLGYVVKVESGSVYLDFTEKTGAQAGQPFTVYSEGEELIHPVTKASLGRVQSTVAEGALSLVLPSYSVGTLRAGGGAVTPGMRARLGSKPAAQPVSQPPLSGGLSGKETVAGRQPRLKGAMFDFKIAGMAIADFRGDGTMTTALADTKTVGLYPFPPKQAQPLAQFELPGVGPRILSLSAGDVNGNGRAELFTTLYNQTFGRVETVIHEWTDGQWKQVAEVPWMVRWTQKPSGEGILVGQQLVEDQTFPYSAMFQLVYKDGKYAKSDDKLRFKYVDFLYEWTQADFGLGNSDPATLIHTNTNHIRVQFNKGHWKTPGIYGQTPTRLRWHGALLEFHPQIPVAYNDGKAAIYLAKNNSVLGSLSEPFGLFNGGELERQEWNGVALETLWRADLGGYTTAVQLLPSPKNPTDIAVAVTGTSGKSSVWVYDP
jgi:hypothetical protein